MFLALNCLLYWLRVELPLVVCMMFCLGVVCALSCVLFCLRMDLLVVLFVCCLRVVRLGIDLCIELLFVC